MAKPANLEGYVAPSGVKWVRILPTRDADGKIIDEWVCTCGSTFSCRRVDIRSGNTKSCGCMYTGSRIGPGNYKTPTGAGCPHFSGKYAPGVMYGTSEYVSLVKKGMGALQCSCGNDYTHWHSDLNNGRGRTCPPCRKQWNFRTGQWQGEGDYPSYRDVHIRIAALRGSAGNHPCEYHCGSQAKEWAFMTCEHEHRPLGMDLNGESPIAYPAGVDEGRTYPYCRTSECAESAYIALCVKCHRGHDNTRRNVEQLALVA